MASLKLPGLQAILVHIRRVRRGLTPALGGTINLQEFKVPPPNSGPYHRLGVPGGPGCEVAPLPIAAKLPSGETIGATLLSADASATEVELLRTIAHSLGIQWGHDDFGWWAMVPDMGQATNETSSGAA